MSDPELDDLTAQLRELGRRPVPAATQAAHLRALEQVVGAPASVTAVDVDHLVELDLDLDPAAPRAPRARWRRRTAAVAAAVGFLAASGGLAAAGVGPAAVTDTARSMLSRVGIDIERNNADCPMGEGKAIANHGDHVRTVAHEDGDVPVAAKSDCGKPMRPAGEEADDGDGADTDVDTDAGAGSAADAGGPEAPAAAGSVERNTADCPPGTTFANHGDYVSSVAAAGGDVEAARRSDCGKPIAPRADDDGGDETGGGPGSGGGNSDNSGGDGSQGSSAGNGNSDGDGGNSSSDSGAENGNTDGSGRPVAPPGQDKKPGDDSIAG